MPLLPAVSGVVAIGAIVSAISTQQISLNFAGGPPPGARQVTPQVTDSVTPESRQSRRTARGDSSLVPSRGGRVSRGASRKAVTVTFRTISSWPVGFQEQVTITNRSAEPVRGWTLVLRYPRTRIVSAWNVNVVRRGTTFVARNPARSPYIRPGRWVKLSFTAEGVLDRPIACAFNDAPC